MRKYLAIILIVLTGCSHRTRKPTMIRVVPEGKLPILGVTEAGQEILLGGFSAIYYIGKKDGKLHFYTLTDRGPNGDPVNNRRPFLLPEFNPLIVELAVDESTKTYSVVRTLKLKDRDGIPYSGLTQKSNDELAVNLHNEPIMYKVPGIDPESLSLDKKGNFWVGEEGGPSVISFDPQGRELTRWNPRGILPDLFAGRIINRGFEGLFVKNEKVYPFIQSPLPGDEDMCRFLEIEIENPGELKEWFYPFESNKHSKIGDANVNKDGEIYVLERDGNKGLEALKRVYKIEFNDSKVVKKTLVLDLALAGYPYEKTEGITFLDDNRMAIVNDNDFGLEGPIDFISGLAEMKDEIPEIWIFEAPK